MDRGKSLEGDFYRRARERMARATPLAIRALRNIEAMGIRGWVVGSLAKGRFSPSSDVDFVVDCPREREYDAFRAIEKSMGAFPFHIIPRNRIRERELPFVMEAAIDADGLSSRQTAA